MKTILFFALAISLAIKCGGTTPFPTVSKKLKAADIMIPIGKSGNVLSLLEFSKLKPIDYEKLANVKLGFLNRIIFKKTIRKLQNNIAADGTISGKILLSLKPVGTGDGKRFHAGGFILGAGFVTLGVLIAYLINDDHKKARRKWAWIGFASVMGLMFILIAVIASK